MDDNPQSPTAQADASQRSLIDDLRQLAEDAKTLAHAEVAYQKSRAAFVGQEVKGIAILGVLAAVFVFFALMALTVGLLVALVPILTAWGATGTVFGVLLAASGICVFLAAGRWKRMNAALSDERSNA